MSARRRIAAFFCLVAAGLFPVVSTAITLEDLYHQSGIERLPARLPQVATKAGGLIGLTRAAVGGPIGLAVGIGLAYVQYQADQADALRVQLGQKNGSNLPVPSGFKDQNTPLDYATTPGTLYKFTLSSVVHDGYKSAVEAAANACAIYQLPSNLTTTYVVTGFDHLSGNNPLCSALYLPSDPPSHVAISIGLSIDSYSAPTCQDGYGVNAQSRCAPITSEKQHWPVDGQPTIRPSSNGGWENHPSEADTLSGLSNTNPTVNINGLDANGNPTLHTITANPDGSVTVNIKTEIPNSSGSKDVDNLSFTTNQFGDVTSVSNNVYNNTTINQVSPVPATNPQNPQPVDLKLPSDYAREQTLQSVDTKLNVDTTASTQVDTATANAISHLKSSPSDFGVGPFDPNVNAIPAPRSVYSALPDGGGCTDPVVHFGFHNQSIPFCQNYANWRPVLTFAFWIITIVYCYRRVSGIEVG